MPAGNPSHLAEEFLQGCLARVKFIRSRVLFGQNSRALTVVFCVDWRQDHE
jgi:hypothetical protein